VQSSLTGHLVFSTLHTNTAVGAITRMRDMGVEPFLLASSLLGVVAQRLVRVLCNACKVPHTATSMEYEQLNLADHGAGVTDSPTIYSPKGCAQCNNSGYTGRTGIHEFIVLDNTLRTMVHDIGAENELEEYARTLSPSIRQNGVDLVLQGKTTLEEVMRVTKDN